jgi:hypothetical protein
MIVLENCCFYPQKFLDETVLLDLLPGQFCCSLRNFIEVAGKKFTKNKIAGSIKKLITCQFLRQEVRHRKTILTITHLETYELILNASQTSSQTSLRQVSDKSQTITKKDKKEKKVKNDISSVDAEKKNDEIFFGPIFKIKPKEYEALCETLTKPVADDYICRVSDYCESTGKRYNSYSAAVRTFFRNDKDKHRELPKERKFAPSSKQENNVKHINNFNEAVL